MSSWGIHTPTRDNNGEKASHAPPSYVLTKQGWLNLTQEEIDPRDPEPASLHNEPKMLH